MSMWRELKMCGGCIYTHTYTHRRHRWTRLRITKLNQNQSFQNSAFPGLLDCRAIEKSSKYGNTATVSVRTAPEDRAGEKTLQSHQR